MNLSEAQSRLVRVSKALNRLEEKVEVALRPPETQSREIPSLHSAAFTFAWGDTQIAQRTIKNEGDDVELYGFTYLATRQPVGAAEEALRDLSAGLSESKIINVGNPLIDFDFAWDWRVARDQQTYLNKDNSFFLLDRQSLGRRETQRHLMFLKSPQRFPAGALLTFFAQPLAYSPAQNTNAIFLQLIAYGSRNGVMAEAVL